MHQIFSNGFLKLKNMNQFFICVFSYMHFFVWFLFGIFYKDSMYDLLKEYEHRCKKIPEKNINQKKVMDF